MTSHIAAFLIIFNQASYHLLSPHEVNILNHAYIISTTATVANMARAQLIAFAIVSSNESLGLSFDFIKSKPGMSLKRSLQNQIKTEAQIQYCADDKEQKCSAFWEKTAGISESEETESDNTREYCQQDQGKQDIIGLK